MDAEFTDHVHVKSCQREYGLEAGEHITLEHRK